MNPKIFLGILTSGLLLQFVHAQFPLGEYGHGMLTCPATELHFETDDPATFTIVQRTFIREFMHSELVLRHTRLATKLFSELTRLIDLDSSALLHHIYVFTGVMTGYLSNINDNVKICLMASNINASLDYYDTANGTSATAALKIVTNTLEPLCKKIRSNFLTASGCLNETNVTLPSYECYADGAAYDLERALKIFGKYLPHTLTGLLRDLYRSPEYYDRMLCAVFVYSITDLATSVHERLPQQTSMEISYFALTIKDPNESLCCSMRAARFTTLCDVVTKSSASVFKDLCDNKYARYKCVRAI